MAVVVELRLDARAPIGLTTRVEDLKHLGTEPLVFQRTRAGRPRLPGIEAASRDLEDPAQEADWICCLLRVNELELH
jgi:hypothetical protein